MCFSWCKKLYFPDPLHQKMRSILLDTIIIVSFSKECEFGPQTIATVPAVLLPATPLIHPLIQSIWIGLGQHECALQISIRHPTLKVYMCQPICITLYTQACNNSFPYFVRVVRQVVVCMDNRYVCFGKNHIMRNRNNCIHARITRLQCCEVLNEGHFATPTDPYSTFEDKTTLLRPDFQN